MLLKKEQKQLLVQSLVFSSNSTHFRLHLCISLCRLSAICLNIYFSTFFFNNVAISNNIFMIKDSILKIAFQYISCFIILQSAFSSKHYLTIFTCSLSPSHFILHLLINLLHLLLDEFSWMNSSLIHLFVLKPFLFYVIPVAYSFLILQYFLKQHNLTCRHLSVPYQHLMQKHIIFVITLYRMIDSHRQ